MAGLMKMGTGTARYRVLADAEIQDLAEPVPIFISPAAGWGSHAAKVLLEANRFCRVVQPVAYGTGERDLAGWRSPAQGSGNASSELR